ncbi:MAG TPA: alpha-glucuronidase family glycosyl hydrolase [Opitutaceae bacterium]|jgi:alpha-glucuronidase|nr:alpha-glucuronidase family glycosyl hydrolase [Opitutaceae bacterium]
MRTLRLALLLAAVPAFLRADDGYRLWLRYEPLSDKAAAAQYAAELPRIVLETPTGADSATIKLARNELSKGLRGLLGADVPITLAKAGEASGNPEGFAFHKAEQGPLEIRSSSDVGILYGAFELLRHVQTRSPDDSLETTSAPRIRRRILDHWDNLNGFVERGFAGRSLWDWFTLPDYIDPRYGDLARADASIGVNGITLNNVNADPLALTAPYIEKEKALADVFRPYGIRVYLSARFSAPIEIGGLKTADPLDPGVAKWWRAKADEIYASIPDFGGFLVKANSEGQPGPQDYGRTHAEGANVLADAVAPHGGIVRWRAFVYDQHDKDDRTKQAYREFQPLDGKFRDNVVVQIKNGPLDFQPREPFHPLFGAMPHTVLALEVQLTQEYLGGDIYLAYLGPLYKEVLDSDTFRPGPGSTVARVVDGSLDHHALSVMAGVANIGSDRNWTGHPLTSVNWYAFGRLAWNPSMSTNAIADEWTRQSFSTDISTINTIDSILDTSREDIVDATMPFGLHHIMAWDHHYGPGPWTTGGRADWTAPYYHHADSAGLGFERTPAGSNSLGQYAPEIARKWGDLSTCPENLVLWFHHVPWDYRMAPGDTLWDALCHRYQTGVSSIESSKAEWEGLRGKIDDERFQHVEALLSREAKDARSWEGACILYFQQFSKRPIPEHVDKPEHTLEYYESVNLHYVPGTPSGK